MVGMANGLLKEGGFLHHADGKLIFVRVRADLGALWCCLVHHHPWICFPYQQLAATEDTRVGVRESGCCRGMRN